MTNPSTDTPTGPHAASPDWPKAALPPTIALNARVLGSDGLFARAGHRAALTGPLLEGARLEQAIADGRIMMAGDRAAVDRRLASLDDFDPNFDIVEP
ncbi:MAG: alkyl sulfatase C-terminal domain-containing protein [Burkholderiaceae bacterium]